MCAGLHLAGQFASNAHPRTHPAPTLLADASSLCAQGSTNNATCFIGEHHALKPPLCCICAHHNPAAVQAPTASTTPSRSRSSTSSRARASTLCRAQTQCFFFSPLTTPARVRSFGPDAIPGDARWRRGESVSLKTARDTCDPCTQICTRPLSRHHETTNPILYPTQDGAPRARAVRRHLKPQSQPPPSLTLFLARSTGTPRWSTRRAKRLLDEHQRQAARPRSLANPSRHWRHIGESVACVCVCGKFARASAGENRVSFKNVTSQLTSIMPG